MKIIQLPRMSLCLLFTAALAVFGSGCATPQNEHSFNDDYNQHLTIAPKYFIEDGGAAKFMVTVQQGHPSTGGERIIDVKRAASAVAETESKRRGWQDWRLDYINEHDQGWMHVVKAVVIPKNAIEFKGGQPATNP